MPGPPPVVTTNRWRRAGICTRPLRQQKRQAAGIFVIARHVYAGQSLFALVRGQYARPFIQLPEILVGLGVAVEARRAEEHDCVLNLFAPEASQRFHVFSENAQNATFGTSHEGFVFIRKGGRGEFTFTHDEVVFPFSADLFRGSEPLPRIRSRYPAIPGRCTDRAQSRWKRRSAIREIQAESDCPSTPASREGSAEELPWRRKQIPAAEPEDGGPKAEHLSAEGGRHRVFGSCESTLRSASGGNSASRESVGILSMGESGLDVTPRPPGACRQRNG